jgi:hypothetical protein
MLTAFERTKNYANRMGIGRSLPPVVRPPLYPIWQLIRGCQSRSSESGRTATPDLFRVLLPYHLDNNNNNNVCGYTWERAHARTHARTHHNNSTAADPRWHNTHDQREHDQREHDQREHNQREHDQREHDKRCAIRPGGARRSTGGDWTGTAERERGTDGHCEPEKWVRTWHRSSGPIARAPGVFYVFMCSFSVEVGQWVGHLVGHLVAHSLFPYEII